MAAFGSQFAIIGNKIAVTFADVKSECNNSLIFRGNVVVLKIIALKYRDTVFIKNYRGFEF